MKSNYISGQRILQVRLSFLNWIFYCKVIGFLYNAVLIKKYLGARFKFTTKLTQYTANFRCYLDTTSVTHEIRPLCYFQMTARCPKIMQSNFEFVTPKGCLVILIPILIFEDGQ